ncbi:MAG TPA: hypothetical protein VIL57_05815 [Bacteroidia bacterium]
MKKHILFFHLITLSFYSFANKIDSSITPKAKHQLHLGVGFHQFQEKNLHYKPYRGISYQLAYSINWEKKNYSTFQFSILNSHNKLTIERELSSMNAFIQLGYAYLWEIVSKNNWEYFLGPAAQLHYNASYLPNWDESHLYWSNSLQLKFNQRLKYNFKNNHNLALNIDLPILGGLSRPDTQRDYKMDNLTGKGVLKASSLYRFNGRFLWLLFLVISRDECICCEWPWWTIFIYSTRQKFSSGIYCMAIYEWQHAR